MAQRLSNYPVIIDCQGAQVNPTTATVMADTGALSEVVGGGGIYEALVVCSTTSTTGFQVQRRNAANDAAVGDVQIFYVLSNTAASIPFRFEILRGERLRIMMDSNLTGTAVCNITAQRVA